MCRKGEQSECGEKENNGTVLKRRMIGCGEKRNNRTLQKRRIIGLLRWMHHGFSEKAFHTRHSDGAYGIAPYSERAKGIAR